MIKRRSYELTTYVSLLDGALDTGGDKFLDQWKLFLEDGDVSHLPLKNGSRPTEFVLAPLTDDEFVRVKQALGAIGDYAGTDRGPFARLLLADVWRELVARSLKVVRYLDGYELKIESNRMTAESIKGLYYPSLFEELGRRAMRVSDPDPSPGQG